MPIRIDVDFILNTIDEVRKDWSQQSNSTATIDHEFIEALDELFNSCKQALIRLSISHTDNNGQMNEDQLNAERIVSKLKELRHSLGDRYPKNLDCFPRDAFDIGSYHVEAVEFFYPVPFYVNIGSLVKLYRWSVYNSLGTLVCNYHLERSQPASNDLYYCLGKFYPHSHAQLKSYESTPPSYNQMKNHIIEDLTGPGIPPLISLTTPYNIALF